MSPNESSTLIDSAGGDAAFGRLLGLDAKEGWQQRINNWRRRGIPSAVELKHYDTIKRLREQLPPPRRRKVS